MRKMTLLAAVLTGAFTVGTADAGRFPEKLTYRYYTSGAFAGTSVIESAETATAYTFKSKSNITIGDFTQNLECYTEYDKNTLSPTYYSYKGTKAGQEIAGTINFSDKAIEGQLELDGIHMPSKQAPRSAIAIFENYVPEHALIMFAGFTQSKDLLIHFHSFFPSDFLQAATTATIESEVALELQQPTICKKYQVLMESAAPFFGYFDEKNQTLTYMDFPGASTEAFLESAWGKNPETKYTADTHSDPSQAH